VSRYAIGGAVAAEFYLEPMSTEDVDVFVTLDPRPGQILVSLDPIYEYLKDNSPGASSFVDAHAI